MHYVDEGRGKAIIFLHDLPLWSFQYRQVIKGLMDQYRCVAFDFFGFGLSEKPAGAVYSLTLAREQIKALNEGGVHLYLFETITDTEIADVDAKNQAYLSMARLLFDNQEYAQAMKLYEQVEQIDLSFQQAELLLEKAWTAYYLGQDRKAMGLLHALRAPSYMRFFLPDSYILEDIER